MLPTLRPIRPGDADALGALWNRSVPYDDLSAALLHEKIWGDPDFAPRRALVAEAAGALAGFGMGVRWGAPNETRGTIKLLCVAPEHRRRGLGGALLAALEQALVAEGARTLRIAESSPNYLAPGLDVRHTPGWLFVQKHGYARVGEAFNMTVDLAAEAWSTAEAEAALAARGLAVRRAASEDRLAVMALLEAHWPAWKPEIGRTFTNVPISLHLGARAETPGRILGFAAYDANNIGTAWFGPMGTDPGERGLGLGGVLCRRCLRDLAAQGHVRATIPWVAPVGFYAHHAGAHVSRVFHRFEKAVP
ncbi:MAG: GNAT family N-acetyltransferase [Rubricoccaceae bacterium]